jgi:dethiobiotin synthetase
LRKASIHVAAVKPFASGVEANTPWQDDDAKLLAEACGALELSQVSPQRFRAPLAPLTAAQLEGRDVDVTAAIDAVKQSLSRYAFTVVEGVGGVAVPLTENTLVSDFARSVQLPVLVVARSDLGTINHTLLTVEHLRARECEVVGVVFVRHTAGEMSDAERTSPAVIEQIADIRNFGMVPYAGSLPNASTPASALLELPVECAAIQNLVEFLIA